MSNSNEDRLTGRIKHDKQEYKSYSAKKEVQFFRNQLYRGYITCTQTTNRSNTKVNNGVFFFVAKHF